MAQQFEDDEDLSPKKKTPPSLEDDDDFSPKKKAAPSIEVSDDDDCEFGDPKLLYRGDGLDRLRPEKGMAVRFAILPFIKPKKALNHYIDKKGTFRCTSNSEGEGLCCKTLGKPNLQIVAMVVHYTNANSKTGKYAKEVDTTEFELKYVNLSQSNFSDISALVQEDERVDGFDIVMTHRETGIGYKVNRVSSEARWQKKGLTEQIKAACAKYEDGALLTKKLGKKLSTIEWKQLLSSISTDADGDDDNSDLG